MKILASLILLLFLFHVVHGSNSTATDNLKHYIVYMGSHSFPDSESVMSSNHDVLSSVIGSYEEAKNAMIYHYHKSFRGFSAMVTPEQAEQISRHESVVSVIENQMGQLLTTRSWDFMGASVESIFAIESEQKDYDVIVGHFDSGIWPESPSFREYGLGPVPERWRGYCPGEPVCNRKVIGYRWYSRGFEQMKGPIKDFAGNARYYFSARDDFGHGTHTASTAVGSSVSNVNIKGMGMNNVVRGGAPGARLAVYKVCWFNFCTCADMLKAYDDAIADGVDLITISIGGFISNNNPGLMDDCFAIGSLHAFQKGILVSSAAGNAHKPETVGNAAPWMLTVGASSIDREFFSNLQLGNSITLKGHGFHFSDMYGYYELIDGRSAAYSNRLKDKANACEESTLDSRLIWRKIVVCTIKNWGESKVRKSQVVRDGGGVGIIIIDPYLKEETNMDHAIPTSVIGPEDAMQLVAYMQSTKHPTAYISPHEAQINIKPAPKMAFFSSRGPGSAPDIIKPDLIAPGLNILSSWPAWNQEDAGSPLFEFDSGTSMACPHASGVAATVKGTHPTFSPAAIKSSIMTTTLHLDNTGQSIKSGQDKATPFDMGSGHLNPTNALNPGLVYDFNMDDVISYLCNLVDPRIVGKILGAWVNCPFPAIPTYNFNYPSIAISNLYGPTNVKRTVTYVGNEGDPKVFHVKIENPEGTLLQVEPSVLDFSNGQKTATYSVNVISNGGLGKYAFGSITWFNNVHSVRSPVAVRAL